MKYSITKSELQNDALFDTMQALAASLEQLSAHLYIVGACARDLAMKILRMGESGRRTKDLDIAVMLSDWNSFDVLCGLLQNNHFKRFKRTQKFYYKGPDGNNDYEVDIVPFGDIADDEIIKWPPDGNPELSVRCFVDIMEKSMDISIDGAFDVKIAPISGQFLIKLDTWNDRHKATDKDAKDMHSIVSKYFDHILQNYPQRFAELDNTLINDRSTPDEIGAFLLAQDAAILLNADHLRFYVELIARELSLNGDSELIYHFMKNYSADEDRAYEISHNIWHILYSVLHKELTQRSDD